MQIIAHCRARKEIFMKTFLTIFWMVLGVANVVSQFLPRPRPNLPCGVKNDEKLDVDDDDDNVRLFAVGD